MKVAVCSRIKKKELTKTLYKLGFHVVNKNPDIIVCYGGDGTVLFGERKFPSIPKLIIKDLKFSRICRKYDVPSTSIENALQKIKSGKFKIIEEMKLKAKFKGKSLVALNEIQVHNKLPTKAIRFSLRVNGKFFDNLIGDGVIVATPFGSTAYYSSVGGRKFKKGIGIAFNNLYLKKIKSFVIPEDSKVVIKIKRGPALLLADNYEKFIQLKYGDKVVIKKAKEKARFIDVNF
jgi:NAD+ kinase